DGIRDRTVTGVQTCALPISSISFTRNITAPSAVNVLLRTCPTRLCPRPTTLIASFPWPCRLVVEDGLAYQPASWHLWRDLRVFRSEERRVGKECSFRWVWVR